MRMRKVASLNEVLHSKKLATVQESTQQLAQLEGIFALYLDERLKSVCRIAAFQQGVLTLVTTQPAAASQIRYLSRIYIQQLCQHREFSGLKRLSVLTRTPHQAPQRPTKPALSLSPATIHLLKETAASLDEPEISEALRRLARHGDDPATAQ